VLLVELVVPNINLRKKIVEKSYQQPKDEQQEVALIF
jgi:hypothetical protein